LRKSSAVYKEDELYIVWTNQRPYETSPIDSHSPYKKINELLTSYFWIHFTFIGRHDRPKTRMVLNNCADYLTVEVQWWIYL